MNKRRLQCHEDKCNIMHVGKKKKCKTVSIDKWKVEKVTNGHNTSLDDVHEGKIELKHVENKIYLGENINQDGSNSRNVDEKSNKGKAIVNEIIDMLDNRHFGKFHFEALKL